MRKARERSQDDIYHVIVRGTGRQLIFEDDGDRILFLGMLATALSATDVELYAWCLMSNHVHLLMHAKIERISLCMKKLCGAYAQQFNHKAGRTGHLFQERFKSEPVNDDAYLLTVIRYIHANPTAAGLSTISEYPWSSYGEYVGEPKYCSTDFVLGVFGGIKSFVAFHADDDNDRQCMDVSFGRSKTHALPDEIAAQIAEVELGADNLSNLKELPVSERNEDLANLKRAGLSVRQIERLTGVGRNIIQRVRA